MYTNTYTLYDISINSFLPMGKSYQLENYFSPEEIELLEKYNVYNFGVLSELVSANNPDFSNPHIMKIINMAQAKVNYINKLTKVGTQYRFPNYQYSGFPAEKLEKTDQLTSCSVLLVSSVNNSLYTTKDRIKHISVYRAKKDLGLLSTSGKNAFTALTSNFGEGKIAIVANAIRFYEEQIIRVARTTNDLEENLFTKDSEEKQLIVLERIKEILDYLTHNGYSYIWGDIKESAFDNFVNSVLHPTWEKDFIIKGNLVTAIRDYTTLAELQENNLGPTLARFISKK